METKNIFFKASLILFSFTLIVAPEYVESEDSDPEEWLDLFGMTLNSVASSTICKNRPPIRIFSDVCSKAGSIQYHPSWSVYSQPYVVYGIYVFIHLALNSDATKYISTSQFIHERSHI